MRLSFPSGPAILLSCLASLIPASPASPQQQPSTPNSAAVVKTKVNEVVVPVVVRDPEGRIVSNLSRGDFQVFDDGRLQAISGFEVVKRDPKGANTTAPGPADNRGPVAPEYPAPAQRFIVFVFDDLNLSSGDLAEAQQAISKILGDSLIASDMVAVLATSGSNSGLTRDRAKLRRAVTDLKVSKVYQHDPHDCPDVDYYEGDLIINKNNAVALQAAAEDALTCGNLDPSMGNTAAQMARQAAARAVAMGEQNYRSNLGFLKLIVSKMGALPGQRVLILISSGFLTPSTEAMELKSQLLDMAARANVIINSVDARELYTTVLDVSQEAGGSPLGVQQRALNLQAAMTAKESVMAELADGTGGTYFHNSNNLEEGFRNLMSGPSSLYLLVFSPADMKSNDAYHALRVKVSQNRLKVQARRGYFAPETEKTGK